MQKIGTSYSVPSYDLAVVKRELGKRGKLSARGRITVSARKGYVELGMSDSDVVGVIDSLTPSDFYKTMSAEHNPAVMQDVYHSEWGGYILYIKFVQNDGNVYLTLLSFKEK